MDTFFKKYGFQDMQFHLKTHGFTDDNFYSCDGSKLFLSLKDHPKVTQFMTSYAAEKGQVESKERAEELMIVDPSNIDASSVIVLELGDENSDTNNLSVVSNIETCTSAINAKANTKPVEKKTAQKRKLPADFTFKDNELYRLLNHPDNIDGSIVLGLYLETAKVDYVRLKDICVKSKFRKDRVNYTISAKEFLTFRDQFIELFPTADFTEFYEPYQRIGKISVAARGCLYNHYKEERKALRKAKVLKDGIRDNDPEERNNDDEVSLIIGNQEASSQADIIKVWEQLYDERQLLLIPSPKNKPVTAEKYFSSFDYVTPPLGICLLELDFKRIFEDLIERGFLDNEIKHYESLFLNKWTEIHEVIITLAQKSKLAECKKFLEEHDDLIKKGTRNIEISLLLLPYCMAVTKTFKVDKTTTITLLKEESNKSFIFYIKDSQQLFTKKSEFDKWMEENKIEVVPYVISCGSLDSENVQVYVVVNKQLYVYENLITAVEACYKCLIAIHKWPRFSDYSWVFIHKFIFGLEPRKNISAVTKFIGAVKDCLDDPYYPRKIVQEFIDFIDNFMKQIYLPALKNEIVRQLEDNNVPFTVIRELDSCFEDYSKVFEPVSTEHRRFNILRNVGFANFKEFVIGYRFKEKLVRNNMVLKPEPMHGVYVSLQVTLKAFLEIPGLFNRILNYINELKSQFTIITNIMQGDLWIRKYSQKFKNDIVLPLFVFYDELEVGNPLGTHAGVNKFGAVYTMIGCLPPDIASKLSSILFTCLIHAEDKKYTNNRKVFQKLIAELNFLQKTGITVCVNGKQVIVKFQLVLLMGDNLGLNGIQGFVESFKANFSCRICKSLLSDMQKFVREDEKLLRTRENYASDAKNLDPSTSGIKEKCVFHEVDNYHIVENISIDMMHDILEGVCLYDIKYILNDFIYNKNYFTLEDLNARMKNFNYGPDSSNKPPEIKIHRLKDKKVKLSMSSAEILCFVRYLGLIIGDIIPENDKHWKLYLYCRQIIDIVTAPRIIRSDAKTLQTIIEIHNALFIELFKNLKPKFHHLLHYPRILLENGPCVHYWAMRCESRHREIKANAQTSSNTINLLVTIATKQMLKMCHTIHTFDSSETINFRTRVRVDFKVKELLKSDNNLEAYEKVEILGITYEIGSYIIINMEESEKEFGKIHSVIKRGDEVLFHVDVYEEVTFDNHFHAFILKEKSSGKRLINYNDLPNSMVCLSTIIKKTHYVATKYGL